MSYFYRHRRLSSGLPWLYVATCDCKQLLFVPLTDRMLEAHPAPWYFERIWSWRIEDNRVTCPTCVAREAVGWKRTI